MLWFHLEAFIGWTARDHGLSFWRELAGIIDLLDIAIGELLLILAARTLFYQE